MILFATSQIYLRERGDKENLALLQISDKFRQGEVISWNVDLCFLFVFC